MHSQLEFILNNCHQMTLEELNDNCSQVEMNMDEDQEYLYIANLDCAYMGGCK